MIFLGVDFGRKYVGLALAPGPDFPPENILSLPTLKLQSRVQVTAVLFNVCKEYDVTDVVFGLPQAPGQKEGGLAQEIRRVAESLAKLAREKGRAINFHFTDEHLTSFAAGSLARDFKRTRRGKREMENSLAAGLILKNFLEKGKNLSQEKS